MIFDRYANVVASHQIEFPQYYPQPGYVIIFAQQKTSNLTSFFFFIQLARA